MQENSAENWDTIVAEVLTVFKFKDTLMMKLR